MDCKTCKYWTAIGDNEYYGDARGDCSNSNFRDGGVVPVSGLGFYNDTGAPAWFYTGEDFGCIHYEEGKRMSPPKD